jgi:hypothetical protein
MEEQSKKGMSFFTKISIVINTLLFGITGILYLIDKNNYIGIMLLAAGAMNIIYSLVTIQTKNIFFAVLNFLFALVSLIVCIDYLLQKGNFMGMVWMIITLYYLITGFVLLIQVKNKKASK